MASRRCSTPFTAPSGWSQRFVYCGSRPLAHARSSESVLPSIRASLAAADVLYLRRLFRIFVGHALALGAIGVACGIVVAAAVTRLISSLLFHVSPVDPLSYVMVSVGLLIAASLASYIPAARAARVDPVEVLRAE